MVSELWTAVLRITEILKHLHPMNWTVYLDETWKY